MKTGGITLTKNKEKYRAYVQVCKRRIWLGTYKTEEQARRAVAKAKKKFSRICGINKNTKNN